MAPLMLVGAVKLAPELAVDGLLPFIHPERSFMHLGFHIYDVGFQSQNSEAAKPIVFTTTLVLISIVAALNLAAVFMNNRSSVSEGTVEVRKHGVDHTRIAWGRRMMIEPGHSGLVSFQYWCVFWAFGNTFAAATFFRNGQAAGSEI